MLSYTQTLSASEIVSEWINIKRVNWCLTQWCASPTSLQPVWSLSPSLSPHFSSPSVSPFYLPPLSRSSTGSLDSFSDSVLKFKANATVDAVDEHEENGEEGIVSSPSLLSSPTSISVSLPLYDLSPSPSIYLHLSLSSLPSVTV